jgi:hypothetical protein
VWSRHVGSLCPRTLAIPDPTVPVLATGLVARGALVLANLVAAIPGRRAADTPTNAIPNAE